MRALPVLVLVALTLSACGGPDPAEEADRRREAFYSALRRNYDDPPADFLNSSFQLGLAICDAYSQGATTAEVARVLLEDGDTPVAVAGELGYIDGLASTILCPEVAPDTYAEEG